MDNYATLRRILKTLQGYILYPDSLGQSNLKKICELLSIETVKK